MEEPDIEPIELVVSRLVERAFARFDERFKETARTAILAAGPDAETVVRDNEAAFTGATAKKRRRIW